jgi:VanZ family protein
MIKMVKRYFLGLLAGACFIMFFVGNPNSYQLRSLEIFWNLGHIAAYSLWTYLLIKYFPPLNRQPYGYQWLWTMGLALLLGLIVEMIQKHYLDRTADLSDLIKNMIGCAFALTFLMPVRHHTKRYYPLFLKIGILMVVMVEFLPLAQAISDEWIAKEQFPCLGTFETPFEITRWEPINSKIKVSRAIKSQGKAALRVDLATTKYSGATLEYFPRDWRGFSNICFDVYNPQKSPLKMICRINDFAHNRNGYHHQDRFNQKIRIEPGWNTIKIPITRVQSAPENRRMNMTEIEAFTIYVSRLNQPRSIYLDGLRLN